jgi:hypothetical protein
MFFEWFVNICHSMYLLSYLFIYEWKYLKLSWMTIYLLLNLLFTSNMEDRHTLTCLRVPTCDLLLICLLLYKFHFFFNPISDLHTILNFIEVFPLWFCPVLFYSHFSVKLFVISFLYSVCFDFSSLYGACFT